MNSVVPTPLLLTTFVTKRKGEVTVEHESFDRSLQVTSPEKKSGRTPVIESFDTSFRVLPFLKSIRLIGEIGAPPVSQWGRFECGVTMIVESRDTGGRVTPQIAGKGLDLNSLST
jgi:hypothetical protein